MGWDGMHTHTQTHKPHYLMVHFLFTHYFPIGFINSRDVGASLQLSRAAAPGKVMDDKMLHHGGIVQCHSIRTDS